MLQPIQTRKTQEKPKLKQEKAKKRKRKFGTYTSKT